MPERLLHDNTLPEILLIGLAQEPGLAEMFNNFRELARGGGQIKERIPFESFVTITGKLLGKLDIRSRVSEFALAIENIFGKCLPIAQVIGIGFRSGKILDSFQ